ncbi:Uncharacterized protein dnm_090620 [Desulfonema magnum]|uniref:Uncharacterized protein n=1 Tax=Desulfonema magnum TaxID=45655 RepID=A0A975GTD8_9BACT|nr:Uncharacterized protein dnm_090620 [Desulfonema magnum]
MGFLLYFVLQSFRSVRFADFSDRESSSVLRDCLLNRLSRNAVSYSHFIRLFGKS